MMMYDKQELIKMVQRVIDCEEDEDTIDELLEILDDNLPHPSIWDLIYWPPILQFPINGRNIKRNAIVRA